MKKSGIVIILVLILIFAGLNATYTVREDQYACTVRFSKIIETVAQPGLHFKVPFLDNIRYFSKATQLYDIPPSEVLTSDKQNMTVDCYILWSISDPKLFYQTLGSTAVAEQRLDALTYNELKTVMGTLAQSDIINMEDGAKRNEIYDNIAADVDSLAKTYGIRVEEGSAHNSRPSWRLGLLWPYTVPENISTTVLSMVLRSNTNSFSFLVPVRSIKAT